jgi:acetyl-CoA synthetase
MNGRDILTRYLERTEFTSYEDFKANYRLKVPANFNFAFDVVDAFAREEPERRALVWCNDHGGERILTFADISRESSQIANWFRSLGIRKGDVVMLIMCRHYRYWEVIMALHKLGAVAIPASNLLQPHDINYRVQAAGVKMIVTSHNEHVLESVIGAQEKTPVPLLVCCGGETPKGWLNIDDEIDRFPGTFARPTDDQATTNEDAMLCYFTSGTTGNPKIVRHNFVYPLGHIVTARYWQGCQPGGLHYTLSDTGWAKAAWGKLYGQWLAGSAIMAYDMDKFHAADVMKVIAKYRVTTFCAPPTVFRFMIQEDLSKYDWSSVKRCAIAGEALNPEVFNKFRELTGLTLNEGFGQTEGPVLVGNFLWIDPKPGSMGKPTGAFDVDIVDEDGRSSAPGIEGEIVIRCPGRKLPCGLVAGYGLVQKTWENEGVWSNDCYHTGDLGWKDEDGYFWFIGRADDVIKSSGYRIGPFEVESALLEHPAVVECAVTGVPDPKGERGIVVKATVVLAKGFSPSDELAKELQTHVKKTTAPYKYPRIVEFVEELPKTVSGKIRRAALRK